MKVFVNGVDLSGVLRVQEREGILWVTSSPWAEEIGLKIYPSESLHALMICTEGECTPFPMTGKAPQAQRYDGKFWLRWDTFAQALGAEWTFKGETLTMTLPPVPLAFPLHPGDFLPEVCWLTRDGFSRTPRDFAGRPFVLFWGEREEGAQDDDGFIPVSLTLSLNDLPEGTLADPFATLPYLFGPPQGVGIDATMRWRASFQGVRGAREWLEGVREERGTPPSFSGLTVLMAAWVAVREKPGDARVWLALAEAQRSHCGLGVAVASYRRAMGLGSVWGRWRMGVALWLQGDLKGARSVWASGELPRAVEAIRERWS